MELSEALKIVLELAEANCAPLDSGDPELVKEAERQDQAIQAVYEYFYSITPRGD